MMRSRLRSIVNYLNFNLFPPMFSPPGFEEIIGHQAYLIKIWADGSKGADPSLTPRDLAELFRVAAKLAAIDQKQLRIDFLSRIFPLLANGSLILAPTYRKFLLGQSKNLDGLEQTFLNYCDLNKVRYQRSLAECSLLKHSVISLFLRGNIDYRQAIEKYQAIAKKSKNIINPYLPCFDLDAVNVPGHCFFLMPEPIRKHLKADGQFIAVDVEQYCDLTGDALADFVAKDFAIAYGNAFQLYAEGRLCGRVVKADEVRRWNLKSCTQAKLYENSFANDLPIQPFSVDLTQQKYASAAGRMAVVGTNHVIRIIEEGLPLTAQYYSRKYRELTIPIFNASDRATKKELEHGMLFASIKYSILHCSYRPKSPCDHIVMRSCITGADRRGIRDKLAKGNLPCNRTIWRYVTTVTPSA